MKIAIDPSTFIHLLVFHLDEENPTMDSPDQGVKGIPVRY